MATKEQNGKVVKSSSVKFAYTNKQRVLILSSRGITARYRHLLEDLKKLIPHHKKDNKLDDKGDIQAVNEIADMKSCNQVVYLETRKHQDLYMYIGKTPNGPSAKFHCVNVHTMDELKLTGNCMLGSRPLLNFDANFENTPHFRLLKTILSDAFGTPLGHPKSKPFVDRIMSFFIIKNNICESKESFQEQIVIFYFC
jgi:ribosome biogenesis protein BRX1